jgi:hypothetical protein
MEPQDPQLPVINLADERIARKTPFGPMSAYRPDPENRIKNNSVTGKEVKPAPPTLKVVKAEEDN